ncbi:MerR family transcriptional regulator [Cyclobacterium qasimii]|uniref:Transcriptional regulator, MerR family n=2 Tax=Cyclobacterium qasimii TaxID=1350429 RepID=S7WNK0_9BACT|nr:MerR family transcriptional regulator [Cyclobacterium qasimii]EPR65728.1 Transcriptional regulator, MerR family [Cyclobacterium qasimii M12-11B]GEO23222.1 MerR family transcriptional regulator [Cyclobacterium qasimii]
MSKYSIKDLEKLSGIKAHTVRIWEQRYKLLNPKRTDTNIRFYDDDDLKLILNVALLNENGLKISKIAKMTGEEMKAEVLQLTERSFAYDDQIHSLVLAMVEFNEERFEKIISTNILKIGFEQTMLNIIYPFLSKIGVLWQTGSIHPGQEHFISNLVRQKLIVAIDGQVFTGEGRKFLLFLPEGELHEISLLFTSYLLKANGHKVIYLGQNTPDDDLNNVYKVHNPDFLVTAITTNPSNEFVEGYLQSLGERFPKSTIIASGYQIIGQDLNLPSNIRLMHYLKEIKEYINLLATNTD